VEPLSLIVSAIAATSASVVGPTAQFFLNLLSRRLGPQVEPSLERVRQKPYDPAAREVIVGHLRHSGVDLDAEVLAAARAVVQERYEREARHVEIREAGPDDAADGRAGAADGGAGGGGDGIGGGDGGMGADGGADGGGGDGDGGTAGEVTRQRPRALEADLPMRAGTGQRITLQVRVVMAAPGAPGVLRAFEVPEQGRSIVVTASAPGLEAMSDLEQDLLVPPTGDSDPVRFGFRTRDAGLQSVLVRAFIGGTFLGELVAQVSVEASGKLQEGRPVQARLDDIEARPGEVTLQVLRGTDDRYQFQLLGDVFYQPEVAQLLADPRTTADEIADELRRMAASAATADPSARQRLENLGAKLWGTVPASVRAAYWENLDRIRSVTVLSDRDVLPWELLYPADDDKERGFLAEQFPVVRRVFGQARPRELRLGPAAFVVPPASPTGALDEVAAIRAAVAEASAGPLLETRQAVNDLVYAGGFGLLHFACHNKFDSAAGSSIKFGTELYKPDDLYLLARRRTLQATHPLIFLNACRSGGETIEMADLEGWATQFMRAGAGAFIGTLWAVRSTTARTFAQRFYECFTGPQAMALGDASLEARRSIADETGDPTWLAYTVYGDPYAVARPA
jgi:hypothetical protein